MIPGLLAKQFRSLSLQQIKMLTAYLALVPTRILSEECVGSWLCGLYVYERHRKGIKTSVNSVDVVGFPSNVGQPSMRIAGS